MKFAKITFTILATLLFVGALGSTYYFYDKYTKTKNLLENPEEVAKTELKATLDKLGMLMQLPEEEATLATILDKEKLSKEEFFSKAENGDKLIIFANSKMAILYRPSLNKIINVAPLVTTEATQPEATPAP